MPEFFSKLMKGKLFTAANGRYFPIQLTLAKFILNKQRLLTQYQYRKRLFDNIQFYLTSMCYFI